MKPPDNENEIVSKSILIQNSRFGNIFTFKAYKAEVVSEPQIWSETNIKSSGGGGYVHPEHGGYVAAPTITTQNIERQRYFIKFKNGKECEIRDAVSARIGHEIWVIFGGFAQDSYLIATYNPNTDECLLEDLRYGEYIKWKYFKPNWLKYFLLVSPIIYVIEAIFYLKKLKWENTLKNKLDNAVYNIARELSKF